MQRIDTANNHLVIHESYFNTKHQTLTKQNKKRSQYTAEQFTFSECNNSSFLTQRFQGKATSMLTHTYLQLYHIWDQKIREIALRTFIDVTISGLLIIENLDNNQSCSVSKEKIDLKQLPKGRLILQFVDKCQYFLLC